MSNQNIWWFTSWIYRKLSLFFTWKKFRSFIGRRLNIEAFHTCEDNNYIKNELFNIISTFDENSVKAYSYVLENQRYKNIFEE